MVVMEDIIDRVACAVGRPVEEVKKLNMYKVGCGGRWWVGGQVFACNGGVLGGGRCSPAVV